MINERRLALSFPSFWRDLCPFMEPYVREMNANRCIYFAPPRSPSMSEWRALICESAFVYAASEWNKEKLTIDEVIVATNTRLSYLDSYSDGVTASDSISDLEREDIEELGQRLLSFLSEKGNVQFEPRFPGCGFLSPCTGDLIVGDSLYEIKTVERNFKGSDLRQALIYCVLNQNAQLFDIKNIGLLNPHHGRFFREDLNELCLHVAQVDFSEFASRFTYLISSSGLSR